MKLQAKYNRINIVATIVVLLAGGLCYYFILSFVLLHQLDKDLKVEEQEIKDYVKLYGMLPNAANYKDQKIIFEPLDETVIKRKIMSVVIYNDIEKEEIPSRQLIFPILCNGKNYKVSITKSQEETEDLIQLIVFITLALVALLLLVLFIINRFMLNKLWNPFNNTLYEIQQFNVVNTKPIRFEASSINEFDELNKAVSTMSERVVKDYDALKSFTEDASHEIQTPLAIVNSKLELLIQAENYTETQLQDIQTIQAEINRLSKLNQSLLLLTKIENQQFVEIAAVDIVKLITLQLNNYEELFSSKQISIKINSKEEIILAMNETLAQILISNLITNAIKHNIKNGSIEITLLENELIVANTGSALTNHPKTLFERFKKDKVNAESLGLGLSIVKKICERYNFKVNYIYENGLHIIKVLFC
jgi:signal transduction histidine kinase